MPLLAVDGHGVVAVGDVVHDRLVGIKRGSELIKVAHLKPGAVANAPFRRLDFAEQQAQQGGFAHAVVADKPDAVAALDDSREIAEDAVAVRVGEARVFGFDDKLAGTFRLLRQHGRHAHLGDAGPALGAHGLQRPDAPHVAGAARLDALTYPRFFLRQLLIEGRGLLFLGVKALFTALKELIEGAGVAVKMRPIHFHDARGQTPDKGAVVADEDEGLDPPDEEIFQPCDGLYVQMVGGLVKEQVLRGDEGAGKGHAALVPARQRRKVGFGIKAELVDGFEHVAVPFPALAALQQLAGHRLPCGGKLIFPSRGDEVRGGQRFAFLTEAGGDHAEDRAAPMVGDRLRHVPE